ncbi:MAG: phosphate signaling complex protein PhoU [Alphaproteobacteria bacterium]|nr:phosphate signaling complex protein PhoU [Alphaproteobacteria bacterium]
MNTEHIVRSYDTELNRLNDLIARMGGLAEKQLADAVQSVFKRDDTLAARTVDSDVRIDELEREVDAVVVQLLALRQPMADDLREVIAALKISSDLERVGDYAANIAKRVAALSQVPSVKPAHVIPRMGTLTQSMIRRVLDAYSERDADKAVAVRNADEEVDEMYTSLFRELLTYMMEDPRDITACTHLLFIAKNIERIGDHATNIAEYVYFLVHGTPLADERPKGDTSPTVVSGPEKPARKESGK